MEAVYFGNANGGLNHGGAGNKGATPAANPSPNPSPNSNPNPNRALTLTNLTPPPPTRQGAVDHGRHGERAVGR